MTILIMNNLLIGIFMMRESTGTIPLAVSLACIRRRRHSIRKAPGDRDESVSALPRLSEESEPFVMGAEPGEEAFVGVIGDAVFPARILDYPREGWIVDVAYLREQVMLHLVVESPKVPRKEMVVLAEISGGAQLMHHPARTHLFRFPRVHGEPGVLVAVGELEHDRHYEPLE